MSAEKKTFTICTKRTLRLHWRYNFWSFPNQGGHSARILSITFSDENDYLKKDLVFQSLEGEYLPFLH